MDHISVTHMEQLVDLIDNSVCSIVLFNEFTVFLISIYPTKICKAPVNSSHSFHIASESVHVTADIFVSIYHILFYNQYTGASCRRDE